MLYYITSLEKEIRNVFINIMIKFSFSFFFFFRQVLYRDKEILIVTLEKIW